MAWCGAVRPSDLWLRWPTGLANDNNRWDQLLHLEALPLQANQITASSRPVFFSDWSYARTFTRQDAHTHKRHIADEIFSRWKIQASSVYSKGTLENVSHVQNKWHHWTKVGRRASVRETLVQFNFPSPSGSRLWKSPNSVWRRSPSKCCESSKKPGCTIISKVFFD